MRINHKIIPLITLLSGFISYIYAAPVAKGLDSALALRVVSLITAERYEDALSISDSLIDSRPHAPEGWFLRASVLSSRSIDFEDELDDPAFNLACDSVRSICNCLIDNGEDSAWVRFYLGSTMGYLSFKAMKNGRTLETLSKAAKMAAWYEETVKIDSSFWDAYLGLGVYYYQRSQRAGILRTIGLVSDRRKEGLRLLHICAEKGRFSALAARSNLAWLAIYREDYETALSIAEELLEQYPESRAFLWCLGRSRMGLKRWDEAIETYKKILTSVRQESRNNRYNEISCLHAMTTANAELNNWQEVVRLAGEALALEISVQVADRKSKDLKRLKKLHRRGLKKVAENIENKQD
ncbi:tetratricopeptide repeat protein [bacterium]|nr:tetratricopeptide repeat protein [bacterium]